MSNFGASVKAFADVVDRAVAALEQGLRSIGKSRRPKPCPIYLPVKPDTRRR